MKFGFSPWAHCCMGEKVSSSQAWRRRHFSKLTQVSIRMLRHYDEIGLLKPVEVDNFTGYRMYSAAQIPLLQKIILLRDSDFKMMKVFYGRNYVDSLKKKIFLLRIKCIIILLVIMILTIRIKMLMLKLV